MRGKRHGLRWNWRQCRGVHIRRTTPWPHDNSCLAKCWDSFLSGLFFNRADEATSQAWGGRVDGVNDVHRVCTHLNALLQTVMSPLQAKINAFLS